MFHVVFCNLVSLDINCLLFSVIISQVSLSEIQLCLLVHDVEWLLRMTDTY